MITARSGEAVAEHRPALFVLDIGLPEIERARSVPPPAPDVEHPVIFSPRATAEVERVVGLELGADDYVTKPFSPPELVPRQGGAAAAQTPPRRRTYPDRRRDDRHRTSGKCGVRGDVIAFTARGFRASPIPRRASGHRVKSPADLDGLGARLCAANEPLSTCTSRRFARNSTVRSYRTVRGLG